MIRRNGEGSRSERRSPRDYLKRLLLFSCADGCLPMIRFVRRKKTASRTLTSWRRTRSRRAKADRSVSSARRCRSDLVLPTEDHLNLHSMFVGSVVCVG